MPTFYPHARSSVSSAAIVEREYTVPPGGRSSLSLDDTIDVGEAVASVDSPEVYRLINVADALGIPADEVPATLLKKEEAVIQEGEVLAARPTGLRQAKIKAPFAGHVTHVASGIMLIEGDTKRTKIPAVVSGLVVDGDPTLFILTRTPAVQIKVAWATGKTLWGTLRTLDAAPSMESDPKRLDESQRNSVVALASPLTQALLDAAVAVGIKGLIVSSVPARLAASLDDPPLTVFVTQGFGHHAMTPPLLNLLNTYNGRQVTLDVGEWRIKPPEIIIPVDLSDDEVREETAPSFEVEQNVRVLQPPHLGEIGKISAILPQERAFQSGLYRPGASVRLASGEEVFVAFANLEQLV